ncbi:unnamed protein product [Linum tenue]|uniref:Receptor-like serine/threonine-protein kinase n=1 Tax=Linum tenue TaxID=586396 RepID=A0AAV0GT33_9ROSI|nr:unnamed protein product [Linum tenue]
MQLFLVFFLLSLLFPNSTAVDSINATQSLQPGSTLLSSGGTFELGFFTPPTTQNRYLGIWYKKISTSTVVWVGNRGAPLNGSEGAVLRFIDGGRNLAVLAAGGGGNGNITWSTNLTGTAPIRPVAQLLETGNLVIRDGNSETFLWQSFDYPGDTFLPGMKYGIDFKLGLNRALTSWRTATDPAVGDYANTLDPSGVPQFFLTRRSSVIEFRSGSWNGKQFGGMINLKPNPIYTYEFVSNENEMFYRYQLINSSVVTRMVLTPEGNLQRFIWVERTGEWNLYLTAHTDNCDRFGLCGPNGICDIDNSPACACLTRFVPKFAEEWSAADWSNGCGREVALDCSSGEGFVKYSGIKLPDTRQSWYNGSMELRDCERKCRGNCSCTAYANLDVRNGGSGCILWFGDLVDIRQYDDNNGQDVYIRLAASEMDRYERSNGNKRVRIIVIPISVMAFILLLLCVVLRIRRRKKQLRIQASMPQSSEEESEDEEDEDDEEYDEEQSHEGRNRDLELPLFHFNAIADATNYFSINNKLGQGGYGPVYKGTLKNGQVIAVKRLSKKSRQGTREFKNEVACIAKLQHRNLVKLLGCCIQSVERMLIYEYMPNKSLNFFIFDRGQSALLDWSKRLHIINGIARGLLYLHQDSRLRIIHRDLKASNVLLDHEMNPKISDFGMARSFAGDESSANTNRIVGTYGYMSPEYAIDGLFSVKSDVFSFGVLVLEIISGRKNRGFSHVDHKLNLLGHAWMLLKEGRPDELLEECIRSTCSDMAEVERIVHIGLLCVQQSPEDRPNMSNVVLMLSSSEIELAQPKEPGFFTERDILEASSSFSKHEYSSTNNKLSETIIDAR